MKKLSALFLYLLLIGISSARAQEPPADYFEFLQQIFFENTRHQYDALLMENLESLQSRTLPAAEYEQLLWMLANLNLQTGQPSAAFCRFFRLASLFPHNPFAQQNRRLLDSLAVTLALPDSFSVYLSQTAQPANAEDAFFNAISFLYGQHSDTLRSALLQEIHDFLNRFPDSKFADILLFWKAGLHERQGAFYAAEMLYRMALQLYPHSPVSGQAELNLGRLYWNHLKDSAKARDHFMNIINTYAEKPLSGEAQFALARLYDDSLKNSKEALLYYQMYAEHFSDSTLVLYALRRSAELNEELHQWREAAAAYEQFYAYAPANAFSAHALERLEVIYLNTLKEYEKAAGILLLEARVLQSPQKLEQAAELYQTQLHNPQKAKMILKRRAKLYPE